jgi:hypothetical protein
MGILQWLSAMNLPGELQQSGHCVQDSFCGLLCNSGFRKQIHQEMCAIQHGVSDVQDQQISQ